MPLAIKTSPIGVLSKSNYPSENGHPFFFFPSLSSPQRGKRQLFSSWRTSFAPASYSFLILFLIFACNTSSFSLFLPPLIIESSRYIFLSPWSDFKPAVLLLSQTSTPSLLLFFFREMATFAPAAAFGLNIDLFLFFFPLPSCPQGTFLLNDFFPTGIATRLIIFIYSNHLMRGANEVPPPLPLFTRCRFRAFKDGPIKTVCLLNSFSPFCFSFLWRIKCRSSLVDETI